MNDIKEYVKKVETFLDLWHEEMISDIELVESIHNLEANVFIVQGDEKVGFYSAVPSSQIRPRSPQTDMPHPRGV